MPKTMPRSPADYIQPLNINGMDGRMLRLPAQNKKAKHEILFVYGLHSSHERWWGLIQALSKYGAVTAPDLPGFGGMDSFYSIGKKPTLDNMADYLAAFIKLRFRRKKLIIVGLSYGFIVTTRMLQRYPELTKKVTLLVSLVGFAHKDDFTFSRSRYLGYVYGTKLLTYRAPAFLFREIALHPKMLKTFYGKTHNAKHKYAMAKDPAEINMIQEIEVGLWRNNDARTWAFTTNEFLQFDNCKVRVNLPVWHVSAKVDNYFDNNIVEQHMRVIFSGYENAVYELKGHAPSVIATEKEAAELIASKLHRSLGRMN